MVLALLFVRLPSGDVGWSGVVAMVAALSKTVEVSKLSSTAQGKVRLAEQARAGLGGGSGSRRVAQGGFEPEWQGFEDLAAATISLPLLVSSVTTTSSISTPSTLTSTASTSTTSTATSTAITASTEQVMIFSASIPSF